jgi:diacylglycerol kinase
MMKNRILSFKYAFNGLIVLISTQVNFRIHIILSIIAIAAGVFLHINIVEWIAIIFCIGIVLFTEAINTAIEFVVDLNTQEINPLAGKIKDVAAAAVLIAAFVALIIGCLVFVPKLIALL